MSGICRSGRVCRTSGRRSLHGQRGASRRGPQKHRDPNLCLERERCTQAQRRMKTSLDEMAQWRRMTSITEIVWYDIEHRVAPPRRCTVAPTRRRVTYTSAHTLRGSTPPTHNTRTPSNKAPRMDTCSSHYKWTVPRWPGGGTAVRGWPGGLRRGVGGACWASHE